MFEAPLMFDSMDSRMVEESKRSFAERCILLGL